jgi:catechol 2,3-dioxygenase-like lactoylglutathione lyase family enzyme
MTNTNIIKRTDRLDTPDGTAVADPPPTSLVTGMNHVAVVTADLDRFVAFYTGVFDAHAVVVPAPPPATRGATIVLSGSSGFVATEMPDGPDTVGSSQMLARGHLDHVAFDAATGADLETIRRRLVEFGASDGTVHDYGPMVNVSFTDPDGMPSEVCLLFDPYLRGAHHPVPYEGSLLELEAERRSG